MLEKDSQQNLQNTEDTAHDNPSRNDEVTGVTGVLTADNSDHIVCAQQLPTSGEWQRLSTYTELIAVADEWIAAASDEQEQQALLATKEDLLQAMNRMRTDERNS